VPYPSDRPEGSRRSYEARHRVNSPSGKAAVAYLLKTRPRADLPLGLSDRVLQGVWAGLDRQTGKGRARPTSGHVQETYLGGDQAGRSANYGTMPDAGPRRRLSATVRVARRERGDRGVGNGPIDAFVMRSSHGRAIASIELLDYREHALGAFSYSARAAYVEAQRATVSSLFVVRHPTSTIVDRRLAPRGRQRPPARVYFGRIPSPASATRGGISRFTDARAGLT